MERKHGLESAYDAMSKTPVEVRGAIRRLVKRQPIMPGQFAVPVNIAAELQIAIRQSKKPSGG